MFSHYYRCAYRSMQPLPLVNCPKRQEVDGITRGSVTVTGLGERLQFACTGQRALPDRDTRIDT